MNDTVTDKEQIIEAVESVHRYRDHAMWDKIEGYFVDKPYIDDQQLTKELPGIKKTSEIINNWRRELRNYFYATRHFIKALRVNTTTPKEAEVTSSVLGQYFITDKGTRYVLNVDGTYHYKLVKRSGRWKIGKITFSLKKQELKPIGS